MARPHFDKDLIDALRDKVITHNKAPGAVPVKLQELRKAYQAGWRGKAPETAAMAKVDEMLAGLAKAGGGFEEAEHPRDGDGKFTGAGGGGSTDTGPKQSAAQPRAPLDLPASRKEHDEAVARNAGYAALQTAVIPETRFAASGALLRDIGSLAAGTTLAVSLARGKTSGLAARLYRGTGGATGKLATGLAAGLVNQGSAAVVGAARRILRNDTEALRTARGLAAKARTIAAAKKGGAFGQAVGERVFLLNSKVVRGLAGAAAAGGETPLRTGIRRAAMIGILGAAGGAALRGTIQGSAVDPEKLGAGIDTFSSRSVRKAVMSDEMGEAHAAMLGVLRKGGDIGDLRKAVPRLPGMYSTAGRAVLSGLAVAGGALAGGAVGAGAQSAARSLSGKRGNPYHDERGRFTTGGNAKGRNWGATIGAIAGGAVAGIGVYRALRGRNATLIRQAAESAKQQFDRRLAEVNSPGGHGRAAWLLAQKDKLVDAAVNKHPAYQAAVAEGLTRHQARIAEAETRAASAAKAWGTADETLRAAKGVAEKATGLRALRAAEDTVAKADTALSQAAGESAAASNALNALKRAGVAQDPAVATVRERVGARAAKKIDREVAALRETQAGRVAEQANRNLAALAVMSEAHGVPKGVRPQTAALAAINAKVLPLEREHSAALRELQTARDSLAAVRNRRVDPVLRDELSQRVTSATQRVTDLAGEISVARAQRASAATQYQGALDAPPASGRRIRLLPDGLRADIQQDLRQATEGMRGAAKALLERPTMKSVVDFATEKATQAKRAGVDLAHQLFFRPDGKGGFSPSWIKVGTSIPVLVGAAEGTRDVLVWARDALAGSPEAKARARSQLPKTLSVETDRDAITGASYAALTVPHPTEEGERIILYGERQGGGNEQPRQLAAGGRISKIKSQFDNGLLALVGSGETHTGDLFGLNEDTKDKAREIIGKRRGDLRQDSTEEAGGTQVSFWPNNKEQPEIADKIKRHIVSRYLDSSGALDKRAYFHALQAAFSNEAQILTPLQRYEILTNRNADGGRGTYQRAIFGNSGDFSVSGQDQPGKEKIGKALAAEMDRALGMGASREEKANLHRAVLIIGVEKSLPAEMTRPIHQKIAGVSGSSASAQASAGPSVRSDLNKAPVSPPAWNKDDLRELAGAEARGLRQHFGATSYAEQDISTLVTQFAGAVHRSHGLDMRDAVKAARQALYIYGGNSDESKKNALSEISGGHAEFDRELADELDRQAKKLSKLADLDDLDALMKAFDPSRHSRAPAGDDRGGEFSSTGGGAASRSSAKRRREPAEHMGDFHPVRVAGELGANAGMQAAWMVAGRHFPSRTSAKAAAESALKSAAKHMGEFHPIHVAGQLSSNAASDAAFAGAKTAIKGEASTISSVAMSIAQRLLPPVAGIAASGIKLGVQLAASAAGSAAGEFAGDKAARAAYRLAGKPVPLDPPEKKDSLGMMAAEFAGQSVGGLVGGLAGGLAGGVGAFGGGVAGTWAGGVAGRRIYDWFDGYGNKEVTRAMNRFMAPERA